MSTANKEENIYTDEESEEGNDNFFLIFLLLNHVLFLETDKVCEYGREVGELTPDLIEVDLTQCRIQKIENFEILENIEFFGLRNNLIKKIENLSSLTTLKELEL